MSTPKLIFFSDKNGHYIEPKFPENFITGDPHLLTERSLLSKINSSFQNLPNNSIAIAPQTIKFIFDILQTPQFTNPIIYQYCHNL